MRAPVSDTTHYTAAPNPMPQLIGQAPPKPKEGQIWREPETKGASWDQELWPEAQTIVSTSVWARLGSQVARQERVIYGLRMSLKLRKRPRGLQG